MLVGVQVGAGLRGSEVQLIRHDDVSVDLGDGRRFGRLAASEDSLA